MEPQYRNRFNAAFSEKEYHSLLNDIASDFNYKLPFRVGESPFFISKDLKNQLLEASQQLIDFIKNEHFMPLTEKALELNRKVPGEDPHTTFLAIDFGICEEDGQVIPKLIEVQGFPSLFNFQYHLSQKFKAHYPFLSGLTSFFNGLSGEAYLELVRKTICGNYSPGEVILLEIEPEKQNTYIDFLYCQRDFGIPVVCVTQVFKKGKQLFYRNENGAEKQIRRIYNRVIFDELDLRPDLKLEFDFSDELDVEWAGHPNWFFRISKFILPYLEGKYFIETKLLSELETIPEDLENYVLKPLFSFSGSGVIFHLTKEDVLAVQQKDLFILQKKVQYKPIIQSPDGKVKAEVRMLCVWEKEAPEPVIVTNLVRLSRGEMIGVKFNKDKDWVGGSIGFFE